MNSKRRKILHDVLDGLERLRDPIMDRETALKILKEAQTKVEQCLDEEEESLDARPENLLWSTMTENMQDNVSDLGDAVGDLECIVSDCELGNSYDYQSISGDVCKVVHSLNLVIYRR